MFDAHKLTYTLTHTAPSQRTHRRTHSQRFNLRAKRLWIVWRWYFSFLMSHYAFSILYPRDHSMLLGAHFTSGDCYQPLGCWLFCVDIYTQRHWVCVRRRSALWVAINCFIEVRAARYGDSWSWLPKIVTSDFGFLISVQRKTEIRCDVVVSLGCARNNNHKIVFSFSFIWNRFFTHSFSISYTDRISNESKPYLLNGCTLEAIVSLNCCDLFSIPLALSRPLFALLFTEKWKWKKLSSNAHSRAKWSHRRPHTSNDSWETPGQIIHCQFY